ncbi:hypothetical protein XELAEV_18038830mg [Xenopus laevis]|uniref:Uncharacterized protein n=1 Tax=Xenopus laevis TaxID=8355 RepID=A0A974H7B5_XENLA|nr:hypothetical protein XELAEV_18038830mg [Xenopus laevis]
MPEPIQSTTYILSPTFIDINELLLLVLPFKLFPLGFLLCYLCSFHLFLHLSSLVVFFNCLLHWKIHDFFYQNKVRKLPRSPKNSSTLTALVSKVR